jgi:hypothetical protein
MVRSRLWHELVGDKSVRGARPEVAGSRPACPPQQTQKVFARVGEPLQALEAKEASGPFDRVHGTKNIGQQGGVPGPLLQLGHTVPCGLTLPGFQSGIPSSVHPLHSYLRFAVEEACTEALTGFSGERGELEWTPR